MSLSTSAARKERYLQESDRIRRFFVRPFFLSVTIGIPFCMYKFLFGVSAVRIGAPSGPALAAFGYLVIAWAGTDLCMNAGRAVLDLFSREAPFEYCAVAQLGRAVEMPMVFLALDTLLSFSIICTMLWSGWIATLSPAEAFLWNGATTLNLISLSVVLLYNEILKAGRDRG